MSRTLRSEHAAHTAQMQRANTRDDWRKVLERRDAKRNSHRAQRQSTARTRQAGSIRVTVLTALGAVVGAVLTIVAHVL